MIPEIWENVRIREGEMSEKLLTVKLRIAKMEDDFNLGFFF